MSKEADQALVMCAVFAGVLESFMGWIQQLDKEMYPAVELVKMCERIAIDLGDLYTVGVRKKLVAALLPGVQLMAEHVDPDGAHFQAFDNSGEILDKLYEIIELDYRNFAA